MQSEFIIVGAGIGGLAAALALGRLGRSALVLEQAQAFAQAGAGIQLGPNAVRVLHGLGLQPALDEVAVGFIPRTEILTNPTFTQYTVGVFHLPMGP